MKVAFDVQGTLIGAHESRVVALFKWFEAKGCEMYVWSHGGVGMAQDAIKKHSLKAIPMSKENRWYDADKQLMDICVDDNASFGGEGCILSADKLIRVFDIPNPSLFDEKFQSLLETNNG